jgi:hypothetical protein
LTTCRFRSLLLLESALLAPPSLKAFVLEPKQRWDDWARRQGRSFRTEGIWFSNFSFNKVRIVIFYLGQREYNLVTSSICPRSPRDLATIRRHLIPIL